MDGCVYDCVVVGIALGLIDGVYDGCVVVGDDVGIMLDINFKISEKYMERKQMSVH